MKTILNIQIIFIGLILSNTRLYSVESITEISVNSINGKVIDQQTKQPIEYASMAVYNAADSSLVTGTITDNQGVFKVKNIKTGSYYVKASFVGYNDFKTSQFNISEKERVANMGDIELLPRNTQINEVVVNAEKSRVEYKIDKRVVNVDKELSAKGGTAASVLENTPSIQVDPQGNVTLRGSSDFIVLIDGKPSNMKGSDILKQIPASSIKQIEVITNPSARYEADGQAGIINVILKKDKLQGMNGNVSMAAGNTEKRTANASVNYRMGKVNVFSTVDFVDNRYGSDLNLNNKIMLTENTQTLKQFSSTFNRNENFRYKLGADYDLDTMNTISVAASIGREGYDNGSNSQTQLLGTVSGINQYASSRNFADVMGDVLVFDADYSHKFNSSSKISFTNTLFRWKGSDDVNLGEFNTNETFQYKLLASQLNYFKENENYNYRSNADFQMPLFSGNFEAGAQFRYEYRTDNLLFKNYNVSQSAWVRNDTFTNLLTYSNTIYSGYATYSGTKWGIGYQVGLRSELFLRDISISTQSKSNIYNKFMFYPSVHFSKELAGKQQLQLSYSRRINRPQPWLLNNNPSYIDSRNIFTGSPDLKPEYTDAYEFNYRVPVKIFTFSTQTYYRYTTNNFQTNRYLGNDGIMYHKLINSKSQTAFGVEQGIDVTISKWWQINSGANIYHYKLNTLTGGSESIREVNTWDARLINSFNTKWGTRFQTVTYYRAPGIDAVGKADGFYTVNLAVNQSLLKGKANIGVSAQNIFNSIQFNYKVKGATFDNTYHIAVEGPVYMVNFSYTFNNFQNKNRGRADDLQFKGGGAF